MQPAAVIMNSTAMTTMTNDTDHVAVPAAAAGATDPAVAANLTASSLMFSNAFNSTNVTVRALGVRCQCLYMVLEAGNVVA